MTKAQFQELPGLILDWQVRAVGFSRATLEKMVECEVIKRVMPPGCGQAHFQKRQVALMLEWPDVVRNDERAFAAEPPLMRLKSVRRWTGLDPDTLAKIVKAGGLKIKRPPGCGEAKYLREQIAALIGMEKCI